MTRLGGEHLYRLTSIEQPVGNMQKRVRSCYIIKYTPSEHKALQRRESGAMRLRFRDARAKGETIQLLS